MSDESMEPTWVSACGRVKLWNADCLKVLPTLAKGSVDAVTDPPFGIGNFVQESGNIRGERVTWNDSPPPPFFFQSLREVSRHRVIWGANYFNCFEGAGALVWLKNQPMPNFSKAEVASVSWGNKVETLTLTWTNFVNTKKSIHPCERPVLLYDWSIRQMPKSDRAILDPFMGSGTTGVAAVRLGRSFLGIEIDPTYFAIAVKRIEAELNSQPLLAHLAPVEEQAELEWMK